MSEPTSRNMLLELAQKSRLVGQELCAAILPVLEKHELCAIEVAAVLGTVQYAVLAAMKAAEEQEEV